MIVYNHIIRLTILPGGPLIIKLGKFPSSPKTLSLLIVSSFPTTSVNNIGRYFSTHGKLFFVSTMLFNSINLSKYSKVYK
jgi:hypothetical protein